MTKHKMIWAALLIPVGGGTYACAGQRENGESLGEQHEAIVLSNGALSTNFTLESKSPTFENTAKVVPPSKRPTANCSNGGISLLTGQDVREFSFRRLVDANGNIDTSSSPTSVPIPLTPASGSPGTGPGT